jgi:hypothetical protein
MSNRLLVKKCAFLSFFFYLGMLEWTKFENETKGESDDIYFFSS